MAYGDYDGPNKEDKGKESGSCNRTLCQAPNAIWYNHGSYSWYCKDCKNDIYDEWSRVHWKKDFPDVKHDMFETRSQMDKRKNE